MKKLDIGILLTLLFSITTPLHAYFGYSCDLFDAINDNSARYGKHGRAVNNVLKTALSTNAHKWDQPDLPINTDLCIQYTFFPETELDNKKNSKRTFIFSELAYAKHKKYHTLDDLVVEVKDELRIWDDYKYRQEARENHEYIRHTFQHEVTLIDKNKNSICFESTLFSVNQRFFEAEGLEDIFGNITEKTSTPKGEKIISQIPTEYVLNFVVDLGGSKFRKYTYKLRDYQPTEEDKTRLLNLFKNMEEQIKKIPS